MCFHVLPNTTSASFVLRKHYSTLLCHYEQVDAHGNGTIDYDEFIATTMHLNWMDREHLYTTFQHFDKDSSGYIMMEELEQVLHKYVMHGEF
ncbi:hypothetical protein COP1_028318 [Malus domestica]